MMHEQKMMQLRAESDPLPCASVSACGTRRRRARHARRRSRRAAQERGEQRAGPRGGRAAPPGAAAPPTSSSCVLAPEVQSDSESDAGESRGGAEEAPGRATPV